MLLKTLLNQNNIGLLTEVHLELADGKRECYYKGGLPIEYFLYEVLSWQLSNEQLNVVIKKPDGKLKISFDKLLSL